MKRKIEEFKAEYSILNRRLEIMDKTYNIRIDVPLETILGLLNIEIEEPKYED